MTQEYETPEWKKWSTVYCSGCYKPLANYKGWSVPIERKLYVKNVPRKCNVNNNPSQR